ncbi:anhydro-N-acetylmuramic acid kinase [Flavobacterium sp.]|uniref:anhydro-N-acetylmuramic acid kinase n=1 Tax=Flavobacterium sp. TaxID=239 RepID=UPI003341B2E9
MFKHNYNVIGVMSGTSLDGVDLAHINFEINDGKWSYKIFECDTISYSNEMISKLKNGIHYSSSELSELNIEYTNLLGNIISEFIVKNNISNLDAVCSHGHTILHQPQNGFTLQIGNLPEIAKITNQKVVCDFRVQDVLFGGQGAPLVPIGDKILFSEFDYCLNLGGFSNISFEENKERIAFDISPVNTVLNFYANTFGLEYDDKGKISESGNISLELFDELNTLEFYQKPYPKSLGFEFVQEIILPILENYPISTKDKMRTFTEHIAFQIGKILQTKTGKLLISGGGVYNDFLIDRIKNHLPKTEIIIPDEKTIQYKEALIFALLGVLKLRNEINVLSSVTGAKQNHSSGEVF